MSDSHSFGGRTAPMCSMPVITDPVLSPAVESLPLDPIRSMFEQMMAGMAKLQSRMDDYFRSPSSSRNPNWPEPDPPYTRANPRLVDVNAPFSAPLSAISAAGPSITATGPTRGFHDNFHQNPIGPSSSFHGGVANPSGPSGSFHGGVVPRLPQLEPRSTWDMPPTSRPIPAWDVWGSRFGDQTSQGVRSSWDLPPTSRAPPAWDAWGNRFSDHYAHGGQSSGDPPGQRHASHPRPDRDPLPPPTYKPDPSQQSFSGWSSMIHCHSAAPLPADAPVSVAARPGQSEETISQSEPSVASVPQSSQNAHMDVDVVTISSKTMAVDLNFPTMNEKFKKDKVLGFMGKSNRLQIKSTDRHGEPMDLRSTMLDADARLIHPHNDRSCLIILGCDDKIPVLSLNYGTPKGSLVIFYGDNEGRRSAVRREFDPGGDISHLAYVICDSLYCFVVPTLRTRWISTVGELIREYLHKYPQISLI